MKALRTDAFIQKLGKRILSLRHERNLSQNELAALMDIDKANYRKLEKGKKNATVSTLLKLCDALGISLKELFDKL